jgi:predicted Zn-dependent peptidase
MRILILLAALTAITLTTARCSWASDPYANVHSLTLDNGLKVVLAPSAEAKTFQIKVHVKAGQFSDEPGKAGVAHLLEHYLFTDAKLEKDMTYLEAIKEKGGSANAATSLKSTEYYATLPSSLAPWAIEVFGKILFEKTFDTQRVEHAKGPVFLEIGRPNVFDYFIEALQDLWPDFARAPDAWQTEFDVHEPMIKISSARLDTESLKSDDLKRFYDRYYHPKNITLFVAGNFNEAATVPLLEKTFGAAPNREGSSWEDPTPNARIGQYRRSSVTSLVPSIEVGTKVSGVSLEDEIVARIYFDYLAYRLMKELRNVRSETYTATPKIDLRKGSGFLSIHFEAPRESYYKNLKLVQDMIDNEARKGQITDEMFQEAKSLYLKGFSRFDLDSESMMRLAERFDYIKRDYPTQGAHDIDYTYVSTLTREDFVKRLKTVFPEDMKAQELSEPPLLFRFESIILMILAFGAGMRLGRVLLAKSFRHDKISWVRKLGYPPAYLVQFVSMQIAGTLLFGAMHAIFARIGVLQTSYLISDYLFSCLWLTLTLVVAQCILAVFARKLMVVDDSLWIKSLGVWSSTVKLTDIKAIELRSPVQLALAPKSWLKVKYRYYFFHPCFWRKALLIHLKNGRSYFVGVRQAEAAIQELNTILLKSQYKDVVPAQLVAQVVA